MHPTEVLDLTHVIIGLSQFHSFSSSTSAKVLKGRDGRGHQKARKGNRLTVGEGADKEGWEMLLLRDLERPIVTLAASSAAPLLLRCHFPSTTQMSDEKPEVSVRSFLEAF